MTTSSDGRLAAALAGSRAAGRAALIPFLTAGHPDAATTRAVLAGLDGLADIVELGLPFSDPVADGPTIQRASHAALAGGMTVRRALALLAESPPPVPVLLFSYLNPILRFGPAAFARAARDAGASGVLITDLPAGADPALEAELRGGGLDLVPLVAPTTPAARVAEVARAAPPFLYLVGRLGVTGARAALDPALDAAVARVRSATDRPVCVGFGVSTGEQARAVGRLADGVVVGSALVERLGQGGAGAGLEFLAGLRGALAPAGRPAHA